MLTNKDPKTLIDGLQYTVYGKKENQTKYGQTKNLHYIPKNVKSTSNQIKLYYIQQNQN